MKIRTISKIALTALGGLFLAQTASAQPSTVYEGYKLFNKTCFLCHGLDGKGKGPLARKLDSPVDNLTDNTELAGKSDRDLFLIIQGTAPHGSVNQNMPQWGLALPGTQIQSLVSYIRFLHQTKHPLIGNPDTGRDVYQRYCVVCHGDHGRGNGPLTKVIKMEPTDHTNIEKMAVLTNEKLTEVIRIGGESNTLMPGWKDILTTGEIKDVISYIRLLSSR